MVTLKQFFETINYRVTDGSEYQWLCFGDNAYVLESTELNNGYTVSALFDTKNQTVYQVEAHDFTNNRSYRLMNPDFKDAYHQEVEDRKIDDVAYDDVQFIELETPEDFIQKATAIISGENYDSRISIPLELPDDILLTLMKQAHEKDITFNEHMENILRDEIERLGAKRGINS